MTLVRATKARNGFCTQMGNEHFTRFGTTAAKSRLNFLELLRAGYADYVVNAAALTYMRERALAAPCGRSLGRTPRPLLRQSGGLERTPCKARHRGASGRSRSGAGRHRGGAVGQRHWANLFVLAGRYEHGGVEHVLVRRKDGTTFIFSCLDDGQGRLRDKCS
jgi:hypothetical protein